MNWRPEGWENPYEDTTNPMVGERIGEDEYCYQAFEDGAEAMLEILTTEQEKHLAWLEYLAYKYRQQHIDKLSIQKALIEEVEGIKKDVDALNRAILIAKESLNSDQLEQ